jgi:hypothetical protein
MKFWRIAAVAFLFATQSLAQPGPLPGAGGAGGAAPYIATTTGAVSLTGTTAETNLAALKIPANTIGKNGAVEIFTIWSYTNGSNNKSMLVRYTQGAASIVGGSTGVVTVATTTTSASLGWIIRANNATNAQTWYAAGGQTPFGTAGTNIGTALTADTTQDTYININGQLAVGTDTLTLQHAYLVVYPHQ